MGASRVKAVFASWGHLDGQAFRLLTFLAVSSHDRERRPRIELSRESMAHALGFASFDSTARRSVERALSSLTVAGALSIAQASAPRQRAHYWLDVSISHTTPVTHTDRPPSPGHTTPVTHETGPHTTTGDRSYDTGVTRDPGLSALQSSGEQNRNAQSDARARVREVPRPRSPLHVIAGGARVASKKPIRQLPLWPAAVNTPAPADTERSVTAQTILAEWLDRCIVRPPRQVVGQVAKHLREMLGEGIDPDAIRRGMASWMQKGLHPATLPSEVNALANGHRPGRLGPDERVADAIARGDRLQRLADGQRRDAIGA